MKIAKMSSFVVSTTITSPVTCFDNIIPTINLHSFDQTRQPTVIAMPQIGLGTYKFKKGSGQAEQAVMDALDLNYRHIDTAFIYGGEQTEKEVGRALSTKSSSIPRSQLFLTSKQWRAYHGYEATHQCLSKSLKRLGTSYLDLYLIHWPGPAYNTMSRKNAVMNESKDGPFVYAKNGHEKLNMQSLRAETWRAMEDALYEGKVRAIGVSNFTIQHLEALKKTARVKPAVNQIELHPYNPQKELTEYCRQEGIAIQAYASLGGQDCGKKTWSALSGKLLERDEVKQIAMKHAKTEAQILLRWAMHQGFSVIPKSAQREHMKLNLEALMDEEWERRIVDGKEVIGLDEDDMKLLNTLDQSQLANGGGINEKARLCWVRDPLRMLDFD